MRKQWLASFYKYTAILRTCQNLEQEMKAKIYFFMVIFGISVLCALGLLWK